MRKTTYESKLSKKLDCPTFSGVEISNSRNPTLYEKTRSSNSATFHRDIRFLYFSVKTGFASVALQSSGYSLWFENYSKKIVTCSVAVLYPISFYIKFNIYFISIFIPSLKEYRYHIFNFCLGTPSSSRVFFITIIFMAAPSFDNAGKTYIPLAESCLHFTFYLAWFKLDSNSFATVNNNGWGLFAFPWIFLACGFPLHRFSHPLSQIFRSLCYLWGPSFLLSFSLDLLWPLVF